MVVKGDGEKEVLVEERGFCDGRRFFFSFSKGKQEGEAGRKRNISLEEDDTKNRLTFRL